MNGLTWKLFSVSVLIMSDIRLRASSGSTRWVRRPSRMIGRLPYLTVITMEDNTLTAVPYLTPSCLTCLTFSFQVTSILRVWWRLEAWPVSTLSWRSPS